MNEVIDRSGRPFNRDMIKYFAIAAMTLNHIAHVGYVADPTLARLCKGIGYFTLITMVYFLVDGFDYTHDRTAYGRRLFLFACLSQIPFMLAFFYTPGTGLDEIALNVLFNLFFCFRILVIMDSEASVPGKYLKILFYVLLSMFSDWLAMAPIFTLLFRWAKKGRPGNEDATAGEYTAERSKREKKAYLLCILVMAAFILERSLTTLSAALRNGQTPNGPILDITNFLGPVLSFFVICYGYNGKKGRHAGRFSKWFFYIYYPAHMLVLAFLQFCM